MPLLCCDLVPSLPLADVIVNIGRCEATLAAMRSSQEHGGIMLMAETIAVGHPASMPVQD
jgi:hypothetical protein